MTVRTIKAIPDHIESHIKNKSRQINGDKNFEEYIKQFYGKIIHFDLMGFDNDYLFAIVQSSYEFYKNFSGSTKIRIFNPDQKEHGWQSNDTVVEIVTADCPFLVDSLTSAINDQGHKVNRIFNRVLKVKRTDKGNLSDIYNRNSNNIDDT